jgi:hypothetical protein
VIGHSALFYWWPVWLLGFIFAGLTYFANVHMALVPGDAALIQIKEATLEKDGAEPLKGGEAVYSTKKFPRTMRGDEETYAMPYMHPSKSLGLVFVLVMLLVVLLTNIHMRGLWSVITIITLALGSVILAQLGWWDKIVHNFRLLAIHINMAGYLFIALTLFGIWLVTLLFFDKQTYLIFTPGQLRVRQEIGGGETAYDTTGMVFQKRRSDMFRHWILGFGSGDLVIRPGAGKDPIELHNVLNVTRRVKEIETLLKERQVVAVAS